MIEERREEEGRDGERRGGTDMDQLPPYVRDGTCNLAVFPDWEFNGETFGVWGDAPINRVTWPGLLSLF